ncbi:MAG: bifunctional (p)ppGpp synthetase/guanosine-3',5'-bis(diphosphate) 3'-pyrophosphohydrolase [Treponema sp.]|nr:bifunctional (p)ppGpp synthetase/guanosine-3',5'-bis(diphosphate) 3'-pyrophosphohydrolase [Treponema sp.]
MALDISTNNTETNPDLLIAAFWKEFSDYSEAEQKRFNEAWLFLLKKTDSLKRGCGLPYYLHPIRVAAILAQAKMDIDCLIAGLFHSLLNVEGVSGEEISSLFGETVFKIVADTSKITNWKIKSKTLQQADAIRKMLFAMIEDVRVILVKLADRLDRMRNLKSIDEKSRRLVAAEVIDIWAPLADRLGMQSVKSELEDLSLKYTNPDVFLQIKAIVAQKKEERASYLEKAVDAIYKRAEKAGIHVQITSRAKHFYSIYQKMRKRNKGADELYDLLALRIICTTNVECYTLIGIVHGLWKPMDGRFKDYIAMPKANGYQSLHTTVICEGKPMEIQIRTAEMHEKAEHGVASHWLYKKGSNHDKVDISDLGIVNQLQHLREQDLNDETFFAQLKSDLLGDEIFVFTPAGDVVQLPSGSTAIDFAYHVHSAVGEKIIGAKADGKIIPITKPLENTQIIEILTNPQAHPTESQLKVVRTSKARQKIHAWLVANDPNFTDREAEARRAAEIAALNEHSRAVQNEKRKRRRTRTASTAVQEERASDERYSGKIKIGDTTNFLVSFAGCCSPKPGDAIAGYVSNSRGVIIHRADCLTFQRIPNIERRTIGAEWEIKPGH